jgi:hypothetical protein
MVPEQIYIILAHADSTKEDMNLPAFYNNYSSGYATVAIPPPL